MLTGSKCFIFVLILDRNETIASPSAHGLRLLYFGLCFLVTWVYGEAGHLPHLHAGDPRAAATSSGLLLQGPWQSSRLLWGYLGQRHVVTKRRLIHLVPGSKRSMSKYFVVIMPGTPWMRLTRRLYSLTLRPSVFIREFLPQRLAPINAKLNLWLNRQIRTAICSTITGSARSGS